MTHANPWSLLPDRDLATRYWQARRELERLRAPREWGEAAPSGEELAGAFQRIRDLDALCQELWRESRRRAQAGSLGIA